MARTKTYKRQVAAKINTVNRKLRDIERTFGTESEQYQRYINATSAALPPDAYTLSDTGRLTIHKDAENIDTLKLGQLKALSKLPTAKRSMDQIKKSLAQNKLRAAGVQSPGAEEIKQQARTISDEEALAELAAKEYDLVLVNIVADVIIGLSPILPNFLTEKSTLICSGILDVRLAEVIAALENAGLTVTDLKEKEDWRCVTARK